MRVLSLRQPWAWVVVYLGKDIENRDWDMSYRGDFLIHASLGMTKNEYYGCMEFCQAVLGSSVIAKFPGLKSLQRGGIVGAATVVGVLPPCTDCVCDKKVGIVLKPCGRDHRWHMPWKYGFQLQNIRPSPEFIESKGMLGLYNASPELVERVLAVAAADAERKRQQKEVAGSSGHC
jgi:hypothetical protein